MIARLGDDLAALGDDWRRLEDAFPPPSFFLKWDWIGRWLSMLPADVDRYRCSIYDGSELVALSVVTAQDLVRKRILRRRVLALHESLLDGLDMAIEYNGLIGRPNDPAIVRAFYRGLMEQLEWDEIHIGALPLADPLGDAAPIEDLRLWHRVDGESVARSVDLAGLRREGRPYLSTLRRKTRYKIRRYIRAIETRDPVHVEPATDPGRALDFLDALASLHQAHWMARGRPGAFANPVWTALHRRLVTEAFERVQILRFRAGDEIVGYIYSIVDAGAVNMIQCGYDYARFRDAHPGYVCVVKAIEYNLETGYDVFDLLVGDAQYKQSLATDAESMRWLRIQRRRPGILIENLLRATRDRLSSRRRAANPA